MPRAERDLAVIYQWIGAGSSDAALAWYRALREAIRSLRNNPRRSPAAPENERFRHMLYGVRPHVYRVIYQIVEKQKEVEILHVRHGAMDRLKS